MTAFVSSRGVLCLAGALLLVAVVMPAPLYAQRQTKEQLQELYDQKLDDGFMTNLAWERSFQKAKERCYEANKPIYGYFTRSYSY